MNAFLCGAISVSAPQFIRRREVPQSTSTQIDCIRKEVGLCLKKSHLQKNCTKYVNEGSIISSRHIGVSRGKVLFLQVGNGPNLL